MPISDFGFEIISKSEIRNIKSEIGITQPSV